MRCGLHDEISVTDCNDNVNRMAVEVGIEPTTLCLTGRCYYQLSYSTAWWTEVDLNHRHPDFQSSALPSELSVHDVAGRPRPSGSRSSSELKEASKRHPATNLVEAVGIEPTTSWLQAKCSPN